MNPLKTVQGRVVLLPLENIDTDQITPARYLKITDKAGMDKYLFEDWRYDGSGKPRPDFVLNKPEAQGAPFLFAGDNFGCGSSREHAVWSLTAFGFRGVISTSFADIFQSNALKNGLLPITVDSATHSQLLAALQSNPGMELRVDVASRTLRLPDGRTVEFPLDPFSRTCLLEGVDELGYLLSRQDTIREYEQAHNL